MNNDNNKNDLNSISMQALSNLEDSVIMPKMKNEEVIINENNHITKNKESKEKHSLKETVSDMYKYVTTKNTNELWQLLLRVLIISLLVIVIYVPFQFVKDFIPDLLISFGISFDGKFFSIYNSICHIIFCLFALFLFFKILKDRFYNLIDTKRD